jgi:D-cysteine desulfhydrase
VCDDAAYFYDHVDATLQALGLGPTVRARDLLTVVDGFKGPGYAQFTPDDLHFIQQVAERTGVLLDTTYTGKAARGLAALLQQQDLGRVCFLHTGGIYGLLDGRH